MCERSIKKWSDETVSRGDTEWGSDCCCYPVLIIRIVLLDGVSYSFNLW